MRARVARTLTFVSLVALTAIGCQLDPPPLGSAPSVEPVASAIADLTLPTSQWAYPEICLDQWFATTPNPVTIEGGAGRKVAVIGDSLTTQSRDLLIARGGYNWSISSFCGSRVIDWLPGGALEGTLSTIRDFQPEAIVIALGTNDARSGLSLHESAAQLLAQLPVDVPVTWVLPAGDGGDSALATAIVRAQITNLMDITVIDWNRWAIVSGNRLDDDTHLTWAGIENYANLLASGTRLLPTS